MNLWTIMAEPPIKVRKVNDIPIGQNFNNIFAIKECECPLALNGKPLIFRVYCLIQDTGNCYVYS